MQERREYMRNRYALRKEYMRKYKQEHREERKKRYAERIEERREYRRKYRSEHRVIMKKYCSEHLNKNGLTKNYVRKLSNHVLKKSHAKLPGYEIHHCFGYEDPGKFIYIPKSLHLKIHQFLRDNHISADTDHWRNIAEIVNECEEYTYIRT